MSKTIGKMLVDFTFHDFVSQLDNSLTSLNVHAVLQPLRQAPRTTHFHHDPHLLLKLTLQMLLSACKDITIKRIENVKT